MDLPKFHFFLNSEYQQKNWQILWQCLHFFISVGSLNKSTIQWNKNLHWATSAERTQCFFLHFYFYLFFFFFLFFLMVLLFVFQWDSPSEINQFTLVLVANEKWKRPLHFQPHTSSDEDTGHLIQNRDKIWNSEKRWRLLFWRNFRRPIFEGS